MRDPIDAEIQSSVVRNFVGRWVAIAFSLFVIYSMATLEIQELQKLSIFLSFTLALAFIKYPLAPQRPSHPGFLAIDLVLAGLSIATACYILSDYWEFIFRVGIPTTADIFFSAVATILVFEAARRTVGLSLVIIAGVFVLYTFVGQYLPAPLGHRGYDVARITTTFFMTQNGIFGVALKVMSDYIFLFIAFGAFYGMSGGTEFFIDLATAIFGKFRGGPAKVAVVASGMMGTISGSAVANTATTGTFTIPLMKKIGFEPHVAGAVEATASSGGALMPPVMGAAAFIMAEFLAVPYLAIVKAALLPAILYYLAIFSVVHFYALKTGIRGLPKSDLPSLRIVLGDRWFQALPLLVLISLLVVGYSPRVAVLWAFPATIVASLFRVETRMSPKRILDALEQSAAGSIMVGSACAVAGIVIGVVLLTGIGTKITTLVTNLSAGTLWVALPFMMVTSLLFGMGLPTVVCYVLLATTLAPSVVSLGVTPMAAHLFIFYFGMLCMVTPPVAFAAYAGAAIAGSDPMKTGFAAWKFAMAGFLLPYMFVYNNALLLMGPPITVAWATVTSTVGIVCLGAAIIGFLRSETTFVERALLFAAAFLLILPGWTTDLGGIVCGSIAYGLQRRKQTHAPLRHAQES